MEKLALIESVEDVPLFICHLCEKNGTNSVPANTYRSSANASNMYSHFRSVHAEVFPILQPIIKTREKNKRRRNERVATIQEMVNRSK